MIAFQRHLKGASLATNGTLLNAKGRFSLLKGEIASLFARMPRLLITWVVMLLLAGLYAVSSGHTQSYRTIVDPVGRTLDVPLRPLRIVSLAPSVTEIVYALDQGHRLVGASRFSNYPPAAAALPKVGSYVQLDIERIAALQPDLCIGIKDGNPIATVDRLQDMGIPVFAVDPVDLDTIMLSVQAIGELLDAQSPAEAIVTDMRGRIARVRERIEQTDHRPGVFLQIGIAPIVSVGHNTFIDTLITQAGGFNVAGGSQGYPRFSREQVIVLAPEVIVISSMDRAAVFEQVKAEWMQWPSIPAVQRGAVFIAPPDLFDRPSPRLIDALEVLAAFIHPELFKVRQ
jgi:iron complex transport system substrate-binding protein